MKFEYQALDQDNKVIRGIEEAKTFEEFLAMMWKQRLYPIEIKHLTKANTKTFGDIKRLKKLRKTIKTLDAPPELEKKDEYDPLPPSREPKIPKDYTYLIFIILIMGLLAAGIITELNLLEYLGNALK